MDLQRSSLGLLLPRWYIIRDLSSGGYDDRGTHTTVCACLLQVANDQQSRPISQNRHALDCRDASAFTHIDSSIAAWRQ